MKAAPVIKKLFFLSLVFAVLPFLLLCLYIHPQADDYLYTPLLSGRNIIETLLYRYNNWTGRYSESFLSLILAGGFKNLYVYRIYAALLILLFPSALALLIYRAMQGAITLSKAVFAALLIYVIYLFKVPEICTLFYYVSCAYNASMGTLLFIVLLSVLLHLLQTERAAAKNLLMATGCILSIIVGGFYEPVFSISFASMVILCLILLYKRDKNLKYFVIITLVLLLAILVAVVAPGNRVRGGAALLHHGQFGTIMVFVKSIMAGCILILNALQNPLLLIATLLFIPVAYRLHNTNAIVKKHLDVHPLIALAGLIAIASAGCFPCIWALGGAPLRVNNQILLFIIIAWFVLVQVVINYMARSNININVPQPVTLLAKVMILLCLIPSISNKNIARAYNDAFFKAPGYNRQLNKRNELITQLKQQGKTNLVLPPLFDNCGQYPFSIYFFYRDITTDPKYVCNRDYAKYLGVDSVRVSSSCVDFFYLTHTDH